MATLSDMIEQMIKELLSAQDGYVEISRNAFAERLNVVPSQISYVIETRFRTDHGYLVESRRGGGGSIRIREVQSGSPAYRMMTWVEETGDRQSQQEAGVAIRHFVDRGLISEAMGRVLRSAVSNHSLALLDQPNRDRVRASILKNMVTCLATITKGEEQDEM